MILRTAFVATLLATAPLAAQPAPPAHDGHLPPGGPPRDHDEREGRLFVSPMGEPFRDAPDNPEAWFAGADANHDGKITLAEFQADAMRFFNVLDADHDHEIGPEEIDHYEQVLVPEATEGGGFFDEEGGKGKHGGPGGHGGGHGGHRGGGGMGPPPQSDASGEGSSDDGSDAPKGPAFDPSKLGATRYSYLALPEPVIAADTDFNRGVSELEFRQAAARRFALLDSNHDGVLTRDELPKMSGAVRQRGSHGPKPESD